MVIEYSKMLLNLILKQGKSLALGLYDKTAGKLLRKCTFKINKHSRVAVGLHDQGI